MSALVGDWNLPYQTKVLQAKLCCRRVLLSPLYSGRFLDPQAFPLLDASHERAGFSSKRGSRRHHSGEAGPARKASFQALAVQGRRAHENLRR